MDEAGVHVEFMLPDGNTTYRSFYLPVGPDDTASSISNRLSEMVEDYINGSGLPSDMRPDLTPVVGPDGQLEFTIFDPPEFD